MKTIQKFSLYHDVNGLVSMLNGGGHVSEAIELQAPGNALFLNVAVQNGVPVVWLYVDTDAPLITRTYRIAYTGAQLGDDCTPTRYRGTFSFGTYVMHLFDVTDAD